MCNGNDSKFGYNICVMEIILSLYTKLLVTKSSTVKFEGGASA